MKLIAFTLLILSSSFFGFSQETEGIIFETGTWDEVVAKAQKENKPIFVDAYTTWCGPCKWMAKNTFTDKGVGELVNKNFVAYKMDMEKGEGKDFAKKNEVNVYPTLLFFNKDGEMIHKGVGASNPEQFLELCSNALNPRKQLATYHKRYNRGQEDAAFLKEYIDVCMSAGEDLSEPFEKYWTGLKPEEKITLDNLYLMRTITKGFGDLDHELFTFLNKNKKKFVEVAGEEVFNPIWASAYNGAVWVAAKSDGNKKFKQAKSVFTDKKVEIDEYYELNKAWQSKDPEKISAAVDVYAEVTLDWGFLNSQAWGIYEDSEDDKELEKALRWANKSVSLDTNYLNLDTKGAILYKLNRLEEALNALQDAVEKIDEDTRNEDLSATEKMLREIQMTEQEEED